MSRWFRLSDDVVNDPKVQRLSDGMFKAWINILCIASKHGGALPVVNDISFILRWSYTKTDKTLSALRDAGLIDEKDGVSRPHNWDGRQHKSDVSTERVKRFRDRSTKQDETVTETAPDTEQIQNRTEQKKKDEDTADAVSPSSADAGYAFEAGVIRLRKSDFDKWRKSFSYLDVPAELISLSEWAAEQEKWFFAVGSALAKRNREAKDRKERPQELTNGRPLNDVSASRKGSVTDSLRRMGAAFDQPGNDAVRDRPRIAFVRAVSEN